MINQPKRPHTFFERHLVWIIVGLIGAMMLGGMAVVGRLGLLPPIASLNPMIFVRNLRGYTAVGLSLGVLAVVLAFLTFFYSIRKRLLQERLPKFMRGTMRSWLWAHVYLGLLALIASILHAGYGLIGGNWFSLGKLLFYVFATIVLSGVLWRLIYRVVPSRTQPKIGNYSQSISIGRAETARVEIEKLLAGKSDTFREAADQLLQGKSAARSSHQRDPDWDALVELVAKRDRGLARKHTQDRATRRLQGLRWLHIPLGLAFVGLLVAHVIWSLDLPVKANPKLAGGFHPAENCADCHADITAQWSQSMHAHAAVSPVTIIQTNQVYEQNVKNESVPDPQLICNNCHAPVGVLLTDQKVATLPLADGDTHLNAGVDCATCHQFSGEPSGGLGGASQYQDDLVPGRVFYGGNKDSVGNAYHQGQHVARFDAAETTCMSCHNVLLDRNGDGKNDDAGIDLVLQTTYREYEQEYRALGGAETCIDCHMKLLPGDRIASGAQIPTQQDFEAPPRQLRSHAFVGVDYPLDTVVERDPQRAEREALLQSAARFDIDQSDGAIQRSENGLTFTVTIDNANIGHKLPTGFAFARQMWVEIIVADEAGNRLFESGVLETGTDDVCDTETLNDAMAQFVVGCDQGADDQLVNFQQKLVDDVEPLLEDNGDLARDDYGNTIGIAADTAIETPLQNLNGGAVARKRPSDGQLLARISPDGKDGRAYLYTAELPPNSGAVTISARLLFRNLPPYFLRALADGQTADETPQLAPLISNLQTVEMNQTTVRVEP